MISGTLPFHNFKHQWPDNVHNKPTIFTRRQIAIFNDKFDSNI